MRKLLVLLLITYPLSLIHAQDTQANTAVDSNTIFTFTQQRPSFKGDMFKFISDSIKYPKEALDKNIKGIVYVTFVIERDGSLSGVNVKRGVCISLDAEALRIVSIMPKWIPAMQNGHPVRFQYMIPIRFELKDDNKSNSGTPQ
jgi:TonB family protein